ncbi:response regulator [Mucilaginibacter sp. RS28]|uniref:Response regulator n=1 Tax=Mucilaginibacter straminoryzae TaxID=2932774 RepID=A0A9X2B7L1_9SPHI|nr:response regulator [Mucilaginibacter straminoryzae]MCJ8208679.1 response regulator [Mucilaginibacter straminoryzae]
MAKILIIEDNQDILEIMGYILTTEGYDVASFPDASFIEELHDIKPDLILIDELLPEVRGSEICAKLKAIPKYKHIPMLLVSTIPNISKIAEGCSADGFIEKPFDISDLSTIIKRFLNRA